MPIYQCSAQAGLLTDKMKAQIATTITDAQGRQDEDVE